MIYEIGDYINFVMVYCGILWEKSWSLYLLRLVLFSKLNYRFSAGKILWHWQRCHSRRQTGPWRTGFLSTRFAFADSVTFWIRFKSMWWSFLNLNRSFGLIPYTPFHAVVTLCPSGAGTAIPILLLWKSFCNLHTYDSVNLFARPLPPYMWCHGPEMTFWKCRSKKVFLWCQSFLSKLIQPNRSIDQ